MLNIAEKSIHVISKAAALPAQYLIEVLSNVDADEMTEIQFDIDNLESRGLWSIRIIEIMKRAKLIADADAMMARFEAA